MPPLIVLNTVALTARHLPLAPHLAELAKAGWQRPLREVIPAVTCTAQASMLTGGTAEKHGIVGNGWFWRDTGEVRFWLQSNHLLQTEPVYQTARQRAEKRGRQFRCAKLFWWFNQGAAVDFSVTPKPHYGADGNKLFDITGTPENLSDHLKQRLGPFPFHTFWGPLAGLPCTEWIAHCAAAVLEEHAPDLTLVYLPHLDYDTQRLGPEHCDWKKLVGELDNALVPLLEAARKTGAQVWVVNEYTHLQVQQPILINRFLRQADFLRVRAGPFGEMLDTFSSRAFAVCDHQIAHIYVNDAADIPRLRDKLKEVDGIDKTFAGEERTEIGLNHPRAGDIVALSRPDAWFAYPYWLDDRLAPDFARTVNIHAKPGYDPCELFLDPQLVWPKGRMLRRLVQKKFGFRTLFDVVPLEPALVKGSHGVPVANAEDRPLMIGAGLDPGKDEIHMTEVRDLLLEALDLSE